MVQRGQTSDVCACVMLVLALVLQSIRQCIYSKRVDLKVYQAPRATTSGLFLNCTHTFYLLLYLFYEVTRRDGAQC